MSLNLRGPSSVEKKQFAGQDQDVFEHPEIQLDPVQIAFQEEPELFVHVFFLLNRKGDVKLGLKLDMFQSTASNRPR